LCDSKLHGTSNLLTHGKVCTKNPFASLIDPNQTALAFASGEGGSLVAAS